MKNYMEKIAAQLDTLFEDSKSGITAREDSRAFGAMIEKRITNNWKSICAKSGSEFIDNPGRRTIYDFANRNKGTFFGYDLKTKDLDKERYSDGGVCSVGNLLKFLTNDKAVFVVVEFGHSEAKTGTSLRDLEYIRVAPFHLLPRDAYRIENLGTGQVRFDYSIDQIYEEIEWDRNINDFFDIFVDLAIKHYERVGRVAKNRIKAMDKFRESGYEKFSFNV